MAQPSEIKIDTSRTLRVAKAATWVGTAWFLGLSILSLSNGELWLDEIIGLSFVSKNWSELNFLYTANNAHIPAWFYLMKVVTYFLPAHTLSPTVYTRGAAVALYAVVLLFAARTVTTMTCRYAASWYLILLTIVLSDNAWGNFSVEAKQQGLMMISTGCAVLFIILKKYRAAAYVSLIPALAHPFGMMASLSIIPGFIVFGWLSRYFLFGHNELGSPRGLIVAFALFCLYLVPLIFVKFVAARANDYAIIGAVDNPYGNEIIQLLLSLPWIALVGSFFSLVILIGLKYCYCEKLGRHRVDLDIMREFGLAAFVGWIMIMAGLMAFAKPSTPDRIHYVAWLTPGVLLVLVFVVVQLLGACVKVFDLWLSPRFQITRTVKDLPGVSSVIVLFCLGAVIVAGSRASLGFSNLGLLGAAQAVNAMVDDDTGVYGTNLEGIHLPEPYRAGLTCPGATLVTMYLSRRARGRSFCQGPDWVVRPSASVKRVLFVDEPGAYKFARTLDLTGFRKTKDVPIGKALLIEYERDATGN